MTLIVELGGESLLGRVVVDRLACLLRHSGELWSFIVQSKY